MAGVACNPGAWLRLEERERRSGGREEWEGYIPSEEKEAAKQLVK